MKIRTEPRQSQGKYGYCPPASDKSPAAIKLRRIYQSRWRADHPYVSKAAQPAEPGNGQPMSPWKQRALARQAKEQEKQVHPLLLEKCPVCGAEFMRRLNGRLENMKLQNCEPCGIKFWFSKKVQS